MITAAMLLPILISIVLQLTNAETYYATPNTNTSCPQGGVACMTISQYASQPNDYFDLSNTTLTLLPGNHTLDAELSFTNINTLLVLSANASLEPPNEVASVYCNTSGRLVLSGLGSASLSYINWFGCTDNRIEFVDQITVEDCLFRGNQNNGSALEIQQVESFTLLRSTFQSFRGSTQLIVLPQRYLGVELAGGVIISQRSVITISESIFENNSAWIGGVAYAINETVISVHNSTFRNNTATGYAGGVFMIVNSTLTMANASVFMRNIARTYGGVVRSNGGSVTIEGCSLFGNSADNGGILFAGDSQVTVRESTLTNNIAVSGGAFRITDNTKLNMMNSVVSNNTGTQLGGIVSSESSFIFIDSCSCVNNSGVIGFLAAIGSVIHIYGDTVFANSVGSLVLLNSNGTISGNTLFTHNTHVPGSISNILQSLVVFDDIGGALSLFRSDILITDNVRFVHNTASNAGAALLIRGRLYLTENVYFGYNSVTSTGGAIVGYFSEILSRGNITIERNVADNSGGAIRVVSSTIDISSGSLNFIENSARYGGAVYLEQNSKLHVIKESLEYLDNNASFVEVNFIGNNAQLGGAIFFEDNSSSSVCPNKRLFSTTTECFIQVLQGHVTLPTDDLFNLRNFFFFNNSAEVAGPILYGGLLDRCTVGILSEILYNRLFLPEFNGITYVQAITDIQSKDDISSDPMRVCFCREYNNTMIPDCDFTPPTARVRKGDKLAIWAVAVDQVDTPLRANILASLSSLTSGFREGQVTQHASQTCTELLYNIVSPESSEKLLLYAKGPCSNLGRSQSALDVEFLPCDCGIGFQKTNAENICECTCDPLLANYVTVCENDTIARGDNFWMDYTNISNRECLVVYPSCPFDYCHDETSNVGTRVNLNVPNGADEQCAFNRTGKLCGVCQDGLSLSLGNSNCIECSNYWLFLLIPFAILGILLVVFILWCNLTVAVGTINGLIFYANVITVHRSVLVPFKFNENPSPYFYISWLNLDWGFPTCFYNGMNSYAKVWLQLAFPLYLIAIVLAIMILGHYSQRFANLLSNRNPVATLATLIILSYTKILRVIISALSLARLQCLDGSAAESAWLFDANIRYLSGKHIPLFLVAIVIIIVGLMYTLLLLFGQWLPLLQKCKIFKWTTNLKFSLFMDTYYAPYTPKYRYWVGLLLLARVFIYLVASYNRTANLYVSLYFSMFVTVFLLFMSKLSGRVYKLWVLDALETSIFLNIIIFSGATLYVHEDGGSQTALVFTSFAIILITILIVLAYHTYEFILKRTILGNIVIDKTRDCFAKVVIRFKDKGKTVDNHKEDLMKSPTKSNLETSARLRDSTLELTLDYIPSKSNGTSGTNDTKTLTTTVPTFSVVEFTKSTEPPLSAQLENGHVIIENTSTQL